WNAVAGCNLGDHWAGKRRLLLLPADPLSPGCGGFQLDDPRGAVLVGSPESLRHTSGAVSAHRSLFRAAVYAHRPSTGRQPVFRNQFRLAGFRVDEKRISPAAGVPGLSLLGRDTDRAVVTAGHGERLLPAAAACHDGETTNRPSRLSDPSQPTRCGSVRDPGRGQSGRDAQVAIALVWAVWLLRALHSHSRLTWPAAASGADLVSRSQRDFAVSDGAGAAAVVFRHSDPVADPKIAAPDSGD